MGRVHLREALERASSSRGVCISVYLHVTPGGRGARTLICNQLQQAQRLVATSYGARRAQDLVKSLRDVLSFDFGHRESGSFAFFHNEVETFWTRLSTRAENLVVVSQTFHVKPLLRDLSSLKTIGADLLHAIHTNRVIDRLPEIAEAISEGRVEHLYVAGSTSVWGEVDRSRGVIKNVSAVQKNAYDDDVLDDLAQMALERESQVTVLPDSAMPVHRKAVAIVRWVVPRGQPAGPLHATA